MPTRQAARSPSSPSGKRLASHVVETNARALVSIIEAIPKPRHLCLKEGALAGGLYEMLAPHVQEIIVTAISQSRGPKSDKRDAFGVAEMLRIGAIPRKVYKQRGRLLATGPLCLPISRRIKGVCLASALRDVLGRQKSVSDAAACPCSSGSSHAISWRPA